ncbi:hypothetical protein BOTBODRAFT_150661 [Botryobasidium botryosum FD-172 SS1]|uniref:Ribosomal protein S6 n=1 Tax=Botryobasidium botryosum (strain FD-172 SS1) TaxID=930990 RepID=A0A067ND57_BOTB1|nr:hypothetical protein BOTBODRAFT_150661 [Botryobasidium botryosum FD-172 SS1]
MPLYELFCISTHFAEYRHIKDLVRTTATQVIKNGGVVRTLDYWGTRQLPHRMRRHQQWHGAGDYWSMHYDASPKLMNAVVEQLRQDPRVIRWTTLKRGEAVKDVVGFQESTITRLSSK